MKMIYTEKGVNLLKHERNPTPIDITSEQKQTAKPLATRVQSISRKSNRIRFECLRNSCDQIINHHVGASIPHLVSPTDIQKQWKGEPAIYITSPKKNSLASNDNTTESRFNNRTIQTADGEHSIGQHHKKSFRLKNGQWLQWKNMPLNPTVCNYFERTLSVKQMSEKELQVRNYKREERFHDATEYYMQTQHIKEAKLNSIKEQRELNYDRNQDDFWKNFKRHNELFSEQTETMTRLKEREKLRLNQFVNQKYRSYFQQFDRRQSNSKKEKKFIIDKQGQITLMRSKEAEYYKIDTGGKSQMGDVTLQTTELN